MTVKSEDLDLLAFYSQWQVWQLLTPAERTMLQENVIFRHYEKNTAIYKEGSLPEYLMCVVRGKVMIRKEGFGGRSQIMRMIKSGEMCGYRAFFAEENYVTEAVACEPTTICLVPSHVIQKLIHQNVELACYFVKLLAVDLGESDVHTVSLTQKHIRGRLADSLLFLLQKYGYEPDGKTLNISLTREDLANLSNMTTSNAIRTLSQFATEKIVEIQGRKIKIEREDVLRKIAHLG